MNERNKLIARFLLLHVFLPIGLCLLSFFLPAKFLLYNFVGQTFLLIIYCSGYWEFSGLAFRNIFAILLEILFLGDFYLKSIHTTALHLFSFTFISGACIELFLLWRLRNIAMVIFKRYSPGIEIGFPFGKGKYLITDGGNSKISRLMNYHYYSPIHKQMKTNASMQFAVDIVSREQKSIRERFFPRKNEDYPVYGRPILCPLDGTVYKVIDGIPDNIPYSGNYPYNTGNTVVIQKDDCWFLCGHIKPGSIRVKEGEHVQKGAILAEAGNSGWTERPHLHMQLIRSEDANYWSGKGMNVLYQGKNLYKNRRLNIK